MGVQSRLLVELWILVRIAAPRTGVTTVLTPHASPYRSSWFERPAVTPGTSINNRGWSEG